MELVALRQRIRRAAPPTVSLEEQQDALVANEPRIRQVGKLFVVEVYSPFVKKYIVQEEWPDKARAMEGLKAEMKDHQRLLANLEEALKEGSEKANASVRVRQGDSTVKWERLSRRAKDLVELGKGIMALAQQKKEGPEAEASMVRELEALAEILASCLNNTSATKTLRPKADALHAEVAKVNNDLWAAVWKSREEDAGNTPR